MAGNTGGMPLFRFMCLRALFMNRSVRKNPKASHFKLLPLRKLELVTTRLH